MIDCNHYWDDTCDTMRECRYCGELQFGTGTPWSFTTVVDGNDRLKNTSISLPKHTDKHSTNKNDNYENYQGT
jgi:hypothetical protein